MKRITDVRHAPGGFEITVEHVGVYTDGSSRFERVFVAGQDVLGASPEAAMDAVRDAWNSRPAVVGMELDGAVVATREVFDRRAARAFARWQRWQTTRVEAQARGMAAGVISDILAEENAAWTAYLAILNAWRQA